MVTEKISDTYHIIRFDNGDVLHLVGTAHVSKDSVKEVQEIIEKESPDRVCIELDAGRMKSKSKESSWEEMDIKKVFKEGKGFLLLANTALASFQKRMGAQTGADPGAEILGAAKLAEEKGIPVSLCDREIQTTFRRAWYKSSLWNKCKLLATLISAAFSDEEISEEELAELKNEETLESMLKEVAKELPSVKEVLIDERDRYLATSMYTAEGHVKVGVIGAGHTQGLIRTL
ncbi:MAG: TraB family protein, partial [Spirochaetales bacterium]|nr:TraB family protein [Candidatus Physcosoma equi]